MDWFVALFVQGSVAQTILLLTLISIVGLALGKIKVGGISLGSGFVFFAAIAAGHFAGKLGIETNQAMMDLAKNFGLVVFVYTLGLQCGPGFFNSLKKGAGKYFPSSLLLVFFATLGAVIMVFAAGLTVPQAVGLLSGSVTNTPSLIAAQQTVLDIDPAALDASHEVGSAYAVAYPFSVLGVILCVIILCKMFPASAASSRGKSADKNTSAVEVLVTNSEIFGKSVGNVVLQSGFHFVISRLWRDGQVQIPISSTVLNSGDRLLIICDKEDEHKFSDIFGAEGDTDWNREGIDWNIIDNNLVSRHLRVTKDNVVGIRLDQMKIRNKFGVNITRINRAGITIVPSAGTMLQFGDRLTVVGDENKIKALGEAVGNQEIRLNEPQLIPLFVGLFLGVLLGSIPIVIPGISTPLKLGIAGGPIVVGILMGAFGPRFHLKTYTTRAANLMIRQMGINFFFASLGFNVGGDFVETVFCFQGLKWAGLAILLTMIPVLVVGILNEKFFHLDMAHNLGILCGSMTNPNALNYANTVMENETPAEAYATVYPIVTFLRVFLAQVLIIALGL